MSFPADLYVVRQLDCQNAWHLNGEQQLGKHCSDFDFCCSWNQLLLGIYWFSLQFRQGVIKARKQYHRSNKIVP